MRRLAVPLLALVALLGGADGAVAGEQVRTDDEGREIRFDVRAGGVDVDWYAARLSRAPHGDEIESVVIRIVDRGELRSTCGRFAAGCYARNRVVVPAGRDRGTARVLLHEYGHHLDARRGNAAAPEPNGTPHWWRARGMPELVRARSVRRNYSVTWSRSVGEIFAEDYAYVALRGRYKIEWLRPPDAVVRQALLADLGLADPPEPAVRRPAVRPVAFSRSGTLSPGERMEVTFQLLGPGRRVTVRARGGAGRIEVRCGPGVRSRDLAGGTATLDVRRLGPAECSAALVSRAAAPARFSLAVRLTIEG